MKLLITKELFLKALASNKAVRTQDMELLTAWLALPDYAVTAGQVMEVTGAKRAALIINNLGKRVAGFLEVEPETGNAASIIALEGAVGESAAWVLREELVQALMENDNEKEVKQVATSNEAATSVKPSIAAKPAAATVKAAESSIEAEEGSMAAALVEFDQTIRMAYPNTPAENRLLSAEMINQLVTKVPTSKRDYQRNIPAILRNKVSSQESNRFLVKVLNILKHNI